MVACIMDESGGGMSLPATVSVIGGSCCVATHVRMSLSTCSMLLSFASRNARRAVARLDGRKGGEGTENGWEQAAISGYQKH